jgi:hypothetical protein
MLPSGFGAAPALCRSCADKIALNIGQAAEYASIKRPVLVPVSAHGSAKDRNCAFASTMRLTMPNRSKVLRARRSMRGTITTSPGPACRASCKLAPVTFSR